MAEAPQDGDLRGVWVPAEVNQRTDLSRWAKDVYGYLAARQGNSGSAYPSVERMQRELGAGSNNTIIQAGRELERAGLVEKIKAGGGRANPNVYRVVIPETQEPPENCANAAQYRFGPDMETVQNGPDKLCNSYAINCAEVAQEDTKKDTKEATASSSLSSSNPSEKIVEGLAERHAKLSRAPEAGGPGVSRKLAGLAGEYGVEAVTKAVEAFSAKGGEGDGLGPVVVALREGWEMRTQEERDRQCVGCGGDGVKYQCDTRGAEVWLCDACLGIVRGTAAGNNWGRLGADKVRELVAASRQVAKLEEAAAELDTGAGRR